MKPIRTLVIHPQDYSTDFLIPIYGDRYTVITSNPGKRILKKLIKEHDRIIMMGHGCEKGLFDSNFDTVIDSNFVYLLREKLCIGIWCNADVFFQKYKLKGLYTGMMISESNEAYMFNVNHTYGDIDVSNNKFSQTMSNHIKNDNYDVESIKTEYGKIENHIVDFNKMRIYYNE